MTVDEQEDFAAATGAAIDAKAVNLDDLAEAYAAARAAQEEAGDTAKRLQEIENRAQAALFDAMEARNLRAIRHKTLGLFSLNDIAWAAVEDPDALRAWALEADPSVLSPNMSRISKMLRDSLRGEGEAPPGVVPSFSRKITWRRGP